MCFSKLRTARMSGDRSEFDTAQDARLKCSRTFQSGILGCALIYVYERVFSCIATDDQGCLTRKKHPPFGLTCKKQIHNSTTFHTFPHKTAGSLEAAEKWFREAGKATESSLVPQRLAETPAFDVIKRNAFHVRL